MGLLTRDVTKLLAERLSGGTDSMGNMVPNQDCSGCPDGTESIADSTNERKEIAESTQIIASVTSAGGEDSAAVVFSCMLPPSAYLTMFLREVTKQSTASAHLSG